MTTESHPKTTPLPAAVILKRLIEGSSKLTQGGLAQKLGRSDSWLSKQLKQDDAGKGKGFPPEALLQAISALGVPREEFADTIEYQAFLHRPSAHQHLLEAIARKNKEERKPRQWWMEKLDEVCPGWSPEIWEGILDGEYEMPCAPEDIAKLANFFENDKEKFLAPEVCKTIKEGGELADWAVLDRIVLEKLRISRERKHHHFNTGEVVDRVTRAIKDEPDAARVWQDLDAEVQRVIVEKMACIVNDLLLYDAPRVTPRSEVGRLIEAVASALPRFDDRLRSLANKMEKGSPKADGQLLSRYARHLDVPQAELASLFLGFFRLNMRSDTARKIRALYHETLPDDRPSGGDHQAEAAGSILLGNESNPREME